MLDEAKKKAATTYNTASDFYDHPANTFWGRYGRQTVERLQLARGGLSPASRARSHSLVSYPRACALGFMLSPASRAEKGFMLSPASQAWTKK